MARSVRFAIVQWNVRTASGFRRHDRAGELVAHTLLRIERERACPVAVVGLCEAHPELLAEAQRTLRNQTGAQWLVRTRLRPPLRT